GRSRDHSTPRSHGRRLRGPSPPRRMRTRRHMGGGISLPSLPSLTPSGRFIRDAGIVLLTFAVGYGISALWISPTSILSGDHAIPRVLGLLEPDARTKLVAQGFRMRVEGERPSPAIPRGGVIWQDPPPGMVLAPNTTVQIVLSAGPAPVSVPDV